METRANLKFPVGPNDEWLVDVTWYDCDKNGPGELTIRAADPNNHPVSGLSQTVLREIDISKAIELMRSADNFAERLPKINWETVGDELESMSEGGVTDEYLAYLAYAYSGAANSPKPLERLAELTNKSVSAIKNHLWQATRKGLLERSPGRAGGRVTMKAASLLLKTWGR